MTTYRETSGQVTQAKEKSRVLRGLAGTGRPCTGPVPPLTDCVPGLPSPLLYTGIGLRKYAEFSNSKDVYPYNPGLSSSH